MKLIKPLLIGLFGLFAVLLGISALLPSQVMTSRWVRVYGGTEIPLQKVRDLRSWPEWNLMLKDASSVDIRPVDSAGSGSIRWTDARGGQHHLEVTGSSAQGLVTRVTLGKNRPFESGFAIEQRHQDSTQIVWYIMEDLKWYPWEKFYGMMAEDMKAPLMQESLVALKAQLEQQPD